MIKKQNSQEIIDEYIKGLHAGKEPTVTLPNPRAIALAVLDLTPNLPSTISIETVKFMMQKFGIEQDDVLIMQFIIREWIKIEYGRIPNNLQSVLDPALYESIQDFHRQYGSMAGSIWGISESPARHKSQQGKPFLEEKDLKERSYSEFCAKKEQLLQSATLLIYDFKKFFPEKNPIFQLIFENCFLVGAFRSLSNFPHFDFIIRKAMRSYTKKRWLGLRTTECWEVRIPLLDPNGTWVKVEEKDLSEISEDGEKANEGVGGGKGYKILEAALLIYKYGKINRSQIKGGFGHHVLTDLLGAAYIEKTLITEGEASQHREGETRVYDKATRLLPDVESGDMLSYSQDVRKVILFLNQFDPRFDIATANTPPKKNQKQDGDEYIVVFDDDGHEMKLVRQHAYSIVKDDNGKKDCTVSLINPRDQDNTIIRLRYPSFLEGFAQISGVKIDYQQWLKDAV
ncbi:MAG: hypothetical protein UR28_C0036G0004 [Candidatus Peregrinibacteria bacterium GW2011_GWF2_33_10]|nr:MAG: hypothetical protein UR28_C0036G0004 [Candidatus Peregrinibacteria bacterium GW2011_GWF2_33_10]